MAISFVQAMKFVGTEVVHAFIQPRHNRFHWAGVLQGLDDNEVSYLQAYEFLALNLPQFDPVNAMPRLTVSIRKISGDKALFVMIYGIPTRFYSDKTTGLVAEVELGFKVENWYFDASGTALVSPQVRRLTRPVWRLTVTTFLDTATPLTPTLIGLVGQTNDAPFTISGIPWPTNSLLFQGSKVRMAVNDVGARFTVSYTFDWISPGSKTTTVGTTGLNGWVESYYDASATAQVAATYTQATFDPSFFPLAN